MHAKTKFQPKTKSPRTQRARRFSGKFSYFLPTYNSTFADKVVSFIGLQPITQLTKPCSWGAPLTSQPHHSSVSFLSQRVPALCVVSGNLGTETPSSSISLPYGCHPLFPSAPLAPCKTKTTPTAAVLRFHNHITTLPTNP